MTLHKTGEIAGLQNGRNAKRQGRSSLCVPILRSCSLSFLQWCSAAVLLTLVTVHAADLKVDLSKETVGKPPTTFEPMVGTWVIA